jgi:hypothetical protein
MTKPGPSSSGRSKVRVQRKPPRQFRTGRPSLGSRCSGVPRRVFPLCKARALQFESCVPCWIYLNDCPSGEMPERSNGAVSKTVVGVTPPRVRIPVSPPTSRHNQFSASSRSRDFFLFSRVVAERLPTAPIAVQPKFVLSVTVLSKPVHFGRLGGVPYLSVFIEYFFGS